MFQFFSCILLQKLSGQSKLAYGVVIEEVATRDSIGAICKSKGSSGFSSSLKSSGIEHIAFLQMKITRSNLKSGETGLLGARDLFQVKYRIYVRLTEYVTIDYTVYARILFLLVIYPPANRRLLCTSVIFIPVVMCNFLFH